MEEKSDYSVRSSGWSPTVLVDARLKDKFIFVAISLARAKVVAKAEFMLTPGPVARELKDWRLVDDEASSDAVWDPGELDWPLAVPRSSGSADKPHPWASGPVTLALARDATAAKLFGGDLKLVCGMGRARFSMLMSCNTSREGGEE